MIRPRLATVRGMGEHGTRPGRTGSARAGSASPGPASPSLASPSLRLERRLLRRTGQPVVVGVDEVGRGALGGPVTVGAVVVGVGTPSAPRGLRDSKLLRPDARARLVPHIYAWAPAVAVAHASAVEIDTLGILGALNLAARRALAALPVTPRLVLLDGNYDWLGHHGQQQLWPEGVDLTDGPDNPPLPEGLHVVTRVKADVHCASVAAASVAAKTCRDQIMQELAAGFPAYGWANNKGYASPEHLEALARLGPCAQHRRTWHIHALSASANAVLPSDPQTAVVPHMSSRARMADGRGEPARER